MRVVKSYVLVATCILITTAAWGLAQTRLPQADRALARDIFRELVEIPTTEDDANTMRAAQAIASRLIAAGVPRDDVNVLSPTPRTGALVARMRGRDATVRPILMIAHLDVVPARREDWSLDPWTFTERDGWFYGRGTSDNKFGVALLAANFIRLKREGWQPQRDVIIAFTGDEETTSAGIRWLLDERRPLVDAEFALNADAGSLILKNGRPSIFTVQASEKMYMDLELQAIDKGGHSSLPGPGNPVYALAEALVRVAEYRFPVNITEVSRAFFERSALVESGQLAADMKVIGQGRSDKTVVERLSAIPFYNARLRTTCVATRVEGGHANNALPQLAKAILNCRILPGESASDVEATVRRLAGKGVDVRVVNPADPSPPSPVGGPVLQTLERLVAEQWPGVPVAPVMETGATDGLWVRRAGIPTYGIAAITEDPDDVRAHGKDERVGVEAFYQATEFWYRMIRAFAGSQETDTGRAR